jgi:DNA (cytosine-5)-methyltransferase 1
MLAKARLRFSQWEIANILWRNSRTIRRWEKGEIPTPSLIIPALKEALSSKNWTNGGQDFTFIDLFAWIGGIRLGFEQAGGKCVFTSEWSPWSVKTYVENFGEDHKVEWDITKVEAKDIPNHDVLLAGFPCQPFSIAGVSKKNSLGRPHGFECTTQWTLFFDVARIIAEKRPSAFLLENVKNLVSHDKGNTFRVILQTLRDELGYDVHWKVVDGKSWVPQHRERILIVWFREKTDFSWDSFNIPLSAPKMNFILHPEDGTESPIEHDGNRYIHGPKWKVQSKFTLSDKLWAYLQWYAEKHKAKWNGFWFGLVTPDTTSRTLSARYYKDGSEILVSRGKNKNPRRLTPRECARLMWFPDSFKIPVSDTQAYRQFGNSVVVPVMSEAARAMKPHIMGIKNRQLSLYSPLLVKMKEDIPSLVTTA